MTLSAGTKLGPYEIVSAIGAGGMGEVYKARDARLGREVAIKVLPAELSGDAERRSRFEQEARAASGLNHPNIVTVYDIGTHEATIYIAMELVEGKTLRELLAAGPLPMRKLLSIAAQVAEGLAKAHAAGIVHRDLKPENLMVSTDGFVKILDFGLAKLIPTSSEALSQMPTMGGPETHPGSLLGTVGYMSPEQASGQAVDFRSDQFAFGSILYEMATGRRAFRRATTVDTLSAILHEEPEAIGQLNREISPPCRWIVERCLAKDPEDRYASTRDLARELSGVRDHISEVTGSVEGVAPSPLPFRRRNRERVAWIAAVAALLFALPAVVRFERRPAPPAASIRSSIVLSETPSLRAVALSPDGAKLAFVARDSSGKSLLWIRALASPEARPLAGTDDPSFPFWSPDSRYIGFFADGKLKKIEATGGPSQTLCDAPSPRGGSWSRNEVIVFSPVPLGPLYRVSASGGLAVPATKRDLSRGESSHRWPFFLPDGRHFLYLAASYSAGYVLPTASSTRIVSERKLGIYVRSLDSNEERFLLPATSNVAYAPPGYLLFFREGNLFAQPFDASRLQLSGEPFAVAQDLQYSPQIYDALFSVSENGFLVFQHRSSGPGSRLAWFDRSGKQLGFLGDAGDQANPRISPDGKRVALDITDHKTGNMDIWIYEVSGGLATRMTSDPAIDSGPIWSPDGKRIAFLSNRRDRADIYEEDSSGDRPERAALADERINFPNDWSPDGRFILFTALDAATNFELWALPLGSSRNPTPFIRAKFGITDGQFSPDGRWVAYCSNESGQWEVFVAAFPGPGGNWKVSSAGGSEPRWRRDGKELFYIAPDGELMAVEVQERESLEAGTARPLFATHRRQPVSSTDLFSYDVAADGQRFLINSPIAGQTSVPITLVQNWAAGAKR
jgi:eukaryotic-like serine/threonine-protein kinase